MRAGEEPLAREEKGESTQRTRRHGHTMTSGRAKHVVALTLLVAALVAGGVAWTLEGTAFWVACGLAVALVAAGIFAAGRASAKSQNEEQQ